MCWNGIGVYIARLWERNLLSYIEYKMLTEGIVKIDEDLIDLVLSVTMVEFCEKNKEKYELEETHSKYKEMLSLSKIPWSKDTKKYFIQYDSSIYNVRGGLKLKIDDGEMLPTLYNAGFDPTTQILYVNIKDDQFVKYLNNYENTNDKKFLNLAIENKRNDIEHELAHIYQNRIRNDNNLKDLKLKNDYVITGDDLHYYTSEIEFDPQVITLVRNFKLLIGKYKLDKKDANKLLSCILNPTNRFKYGLPLGLANEIPMKFLFSLKNVTERKYKIAIRKFFVEATKILSKMEDENPLDHYPHTLYQK